MVVELVGHRSFTLTTTNNKGAGYVASKMASHMQGSFLAPFFFNIYTSDLPKRLQEVCIRR